MSEWFSVVLFHDCWMIRAPEGTSERGMALCNFLARESDGICTMEISEGTQPSIGDFAMKSCPTQLWLLSEYLVCFK
jgi:hypothetical protein